MSGRPSSVRSGPYAPPTPDRELTVTSADGARLYAQVHGPREAPAVLLSHGWTCSTAFWAPIVHRLSADHRVIVYDQRGHGRSAPATASGYRTRILVEDLVAVADQTLGPGERAVLVGHSMGAMTLIAAADQPLLRERAAAVALCSTGTARLVAEARLLPLRPGPVRTRIQGAILGSHAPLGPVTPLARRVLKYATMGRHATPAMVEACALIVHSCPRAVRAGWAEVLGTLDLESHVSRLTVPTAVVVGTADRLTPPVHAHGLAAGLSHCVGLTELSGIGHMTPLETPDVVSEVIRALVVDHLRAPAAAAPPPGPVRADQEETA